MPDKEEAEIWEGSMEEGWEPSNCLVGLGTGEGLLGLSVPYCQSPDKGSLRFLTLAQHLLEGKVEPESQGGSACADLREECRARIPAHQDHIQC